MSSGTIVRSLKDFVSEIQCNTFIIKVIKLSYDNLITLVFNVLI